MPGMMEDIVNGIKKKFLNKGSKHTEKTTGSLDGYIKRTESTMDRLKSAQDAAAAEKIKINKLERSFNIIERTVLGAVYDVNGDVLNSIDVETGDLTRTFPTIDHGVPMPECKPPSDINDQQDISRELEVELMAEKLYSEIKSIGYQDMEVIKKLLMQEWPQPVTKSKYPRDIQDEIDTAVQALSLDTPFLASSKAQLEECLKTVWPQGKNSMDMPYTVKEIAKAVQKATPRAENTPLISIEEAIKTVWPKTENSIDSLPPIESTTIYLKAE